MKTQHTYDFITQKLGRTSAPDTAALWKGMNEVLDREMPREKKRRFFWLLPVNVWLLLTALTGVAAGTFYLAGSHTKDIAERSAPLKTSAGAAHSVPVQPTQKAVANTDSPISNADVKNEDLGDQDSRMMSTKVNKSTTKANKRTVKANRISTVANHLPATALTSSDNTMDEETAAVTSPSSTLGYWPKVNGSANTAYRFAPPAANKRKDVVPRLPQGIAHRGRGFSAGVGINMAVPVGKQERSNVGFNGQKSTALDYLPSVFVQYHFNNRLSLRSGFQWMAPQYVRQYNMYEQYSDAVANHYREDNITLRKLYYLTIPLTVQYKLSPRIQIGGGLEYAHIQRSLFENEACMWQQDAGTWWKPWQDNSMSAVHNKLVDDNAPNATPLDTAAYSIKHNDWRLQLNASYQWKRLELGVQASSGISPYVNTTQKGYYNTPVRAVNRSLEFYLHYTLFSRRTH